MKNRVKNRKAIKTVKKGFTLAETLIAVFIFALLVVMISGTFSSFFKAYISERKSQKDLENAQYALNLMEKTIRTSVVYTSAGPMSPQLDFNGVDTHTIRMFDDSQGKCVAYWWDAANKEMMIDNFNSTTSDITGCGFDSSLAASNFSPLTSNDIVAVSVSGIPSQTGAAGQVTVALTVQDSAGLAPMHLQMTSSLRDFVAS